MVSHLEIIHMNKFTCGTSAQVLINLGSGPVLSMPLQQDDRMRFGMAQVCCWLLLKVMPIPIHEPRHLHHRWTILHTCDVVPLNLHPTERKTSLRDTSWNLCALCAGLSWSSAPWTAGYQLWTLTTREGSSGTWMWAQDAWCLLASANPR